MRSGGSRCLLRSARTAWRKLDVEPPPGRQKSMSVRLVRRRVQEAVRAQLARAGFGLLGGVPLEHETDERCVVRMLRLDRAGSVAILGERHAIVGANVQGCAHELPHLEWRSHLPFCTRCYEPTLVASIALHPWSASRETESAQPRPRGCAGGIYPRDDAVERGTSELPRRNSVHARNAAAVRS